METNNGHSGAVETTTNAITVSERNTYICIQRMQGTSIRYLPKPQIEMLFACPDFVSGTDAEADADAAAPTKPQSQERRFCFCGVKGSSATG